MGKNDAARNGAVKPVNHTEEDVAGLGTRFLDVLFHRLHQRLVAGLVALDDFSRTLVDDDEMVVFVEDVHYMFMPPSTWMTCPLTYEERSLAR